MPRSTTRLPAIPLSIASSTARTGSTTTGRKIFLRVLSFLARDGIRSISLCRDLQAGCPQDGKACSTNDTSAQGSEGGLGRCRSSADLLEDSQLVRAAPPLDHFAVPKSRDLNAPRVNL